jgi:hypothetical protein
MGKRELSFTYRAGHSALPIKLDKILMLTSYVSRKQGFVCMHMHLKPDKSPFIKGGVLRILSLAALKF